MADWLSGYVEVNGVRLHYTRTGGDKPSLVMLHGVTDSALTWVKITRELEMDYDVILVDRRGHGLSDAPEDGYTFTDHAADLAGLVKALDLQRPIIIGHSGGAATAAYFAAEYPELLSCLILEDPPWGTGWGTWEEMAAVMTEYFKNVKSKTREELISNRGKHYPTWSDEDSSNWVVSKLQLSPHVIRSFSQPKPDLEYLFSRITTPVLLITSDLEMEAINTEDDVKLLESLWQDGRAVRIPGTTHTIHNDRLRAFLSVVVTFLDAMKERERHCNFRYRNI
jgi:pimeloyl-ACP methyl ester carboxylesterase